MELHGGEPDQLDLLHLERSLAVEATSPRLHQLLMRTNGRPVSLKIKKILISKNLIKCQSKKPTLYMMMKMHLKMAWRKKKYTLISPTPTPFPKTS